MRQSCTHLDNERRFVAKCSRGKNDKTSSEIIVLVSVETFYSKSLFLYLTFPSTEHVRKTLRFQGLQNAPMLANKPEDSPPC